MKKSIIVAGHSPADLNQQIQKLEEDGWELVAKSLYIAAYPPGVYPPDVYRYAVIMTKGAEQTQDV